MPPGGGDYLLAVKDNQPGLHDDIHIVADGVAARRNAPAVAVGRLKAAVNQP